MEMYKGQQEERKRSRLVIHISGAPGSGKTTLGNKIASSFPQVLVIDTDDFIQHHTEEGKKLLAMEKELLDTAMEESKKVLASLAYKREWSAILTHKFNQVLQSNPTADIVFVGVLDNFGPLDGSIYDFKEATHRFYLSPPLATVLKQYYGRLASNDDNYWRHVASKDYNIQSSHEFIAGFDKYATWHREHGFTAI